MGLLDKSAQLLSANRLCLFIVVCFEAAVGSRHPAIYVCYSIIDH